MGQNSEWGAFCGGVFDESLLHAAICAAAVGALGGDTLRGAVGGACRLGLWRLDAGIGGKWVHGMAQLAGETGLKPPC